jgi:16S rRNA (cytidine1402-2'-O)-methyltransferase
VNHQNKSDRAGAGGNSGALFVVGTPLGNLEDMTLRAIRTLREVDLVAAEDTRRTAKLLAHLQIQKPTVSYYHHNEQGRTEDLIARLTAGTHIALVTDAGMPGISDPGAILIAAALAANIPVIPIPGPTAATTALVISGLPTDRYVFEGFLPRSGKPRKARLVELAAETRTIVLYEAPHRLIRTLNDLYDQLGERPVAVARELTKVHEECIRGTLCEVIAHFTAHPPRGEFVVVLAGKKAQGEEQEWGEDGERQLPALLRAALQAGLSRPDAVKAVMKQTGLPRREVYQASLSLDASNEDSEK